MKDKETYQRLLISQEGTINSLKTEVQNLKDEVIELRKKTGKEAGLLADKEALHKLLVEKEGAVNQLHL